MDEQIRTIMMTGAAALLFATTFMFGGRFHPAQWLTSDRRDVVSFGAGISVAYVFVHMMPELHGARKALAASVAAPLRFEGMAVYFVALAGFLAFYGLEYLRAQLRGASEAGRADLAFRTHIGGFAVYVWLMSYLLVDSLEKSAVSIVLYTVAMTVHFLSLDHALREEHGAAYQRTGRFVLAAMALLGWAAGIAFALPDHLLALLVAFISGAVVMNSAVMELPAEKDGRFLPFVIGGLVYGLILIPL